MLSYTHELCHAIDLFVRLFVVCFAAGVWWLQAQSRTAGHRLGIGAPRCWQWHCWLRTGPVYNDASYTSRIRRSGHACFAVPWAALFAQFRLADALSPEWEGEDIRVVGVIATMPQPYERSVQFRVRCRARTDTDAVVPGHVCSRGGAAQSAGRARPARTSRRASAGN